MKHRRVVAAVASCVLPAVTAIVNVQSASASTSALAQAAIGVSYPSTTTFNVCPYGTTASGSGQWVFELYGVREDGTQIHIEQTGFGTTFNPGCYLISTNSTADGGFDAVLSYARSGSPIDTSGVNSEPVPELTALAGLEAHWTPQQNANAFSL